MFANDNFNLDRVKNIIETGKNAFLSIFSFSVIFSKDFFSGVVNRQHCALEVDRVENIMRKRENADYHHFILFSTGFFSRGVILPHNSFGSAQDLRTGGRRLNPLTWPIFFPRIDDSHCDRIHFSLITVLCFDDDYVGKQPVAWKEYCAEYWLIELQESMDRCTGRHDMTEILLKRALNNIQSNQINLRIRPRQTIVFKTGVVAFSLGAQDYGNSTTTGPPVTG